jgi:hypothetical protein
VKSCRSESSPVCCIWWRGCLLAMCDGLRGSWRRRVIGHWSVMRGIYGRTRRRSWCGWWTWERLCGADTRASTCMRYGCFFQVGNYGVQRVIFMFRVDWRLWVAHYLELVRLHYSPQRVNEHGGVVLRPEIYVHSVQAIHVLSIASRIRDGQMPL